MSKNHNMLLIDGDRRVPVWGDGGDLWPSRQIAEDRGFRNPTATYKPTEWDANDNEIRWAPIGTTGYLVDLP